MARIGIDARLYGVTSGTGIGRYTEELLRALAILDRDNEYVVFLQQDGVERFRPPNNRWTTIDADFRPYTIGVQTAYPKLIRDARVDLMHFTHFDHPIRCPVPFLITIHDLILRHHPSIRATTLGPIHFGIKYLAYRTVLWHATHRGRHIFTPSETIRQQLHDELGVPLHHITATPLGVDHCTRITKRTQEPFCLPSPYLVYVGNAYPHKQLRTLIASVHACRQNPILRDLMLVLIGRNDDFSQHLRAETQHYPWVIFAGALREHERTPIVRNALASITGSADEGFDLPTVEALALGTPVIASDIAVHREILGDAALILNIGDPRALEASLCELVINTRSRELRATLAEKGRARAAQFTWTRCAQRTLTAYRTCLDAEPPRHDEHAAHRPPISRPRTSSPISRPG